MQLTDFDRLPWLLTEHDLLTVGYDRRTVAKLVDCGVLARLHLPGVAHARYRKYQVAQLLKLAPLPPAATAAFQAEPLAMSLHAVQRWTGFHRQTLEKLVAAQGLSCLQPPGTRNGKFLKAEIARLIGFDSLM